MQALRSTLFPYTTLFRSLDHSWSQRHEISFRYLYDSRMGSPISGQVFFPGYFGDASNRHQNFLVRDRKSTRLNSSHLGISYAVFCVKKKNVFPAANKLAM